MTKDGIDDREALARSRSAEVLGADPESFESPLTVLASPAWRGVEGDIWRASVGDISVVLKHYHSDTAFYVNTDQAIDATEHAGTLGIGPVVKQSWPEDGIVALADLAVPWRAGGLHDAVNESVRSEVIALKKRFQKDAQLKNNACVFDEIDKLASIIQSESLTTHRDLAVFLDYFVGARHKIDSMGADRVACHRDGNTANIMVDTANRVQLLDFDLAANCDPFEELGFYLGEFYESDADARTGFEQWHGHVDEGLFQRSMIYGLADDMRWGLIASIMAARSPRQHLEFAKYAAWRFLRLETHLKRSDANDRIRAAA